MQSAKQLCAALGALLAITLAAGFGVRTAQAATPHAAGSVPLVAQPADIPPVPVAPSPGAPEPTTPLTPLPAGDTPYPVVLPPIRVGPLLPVTHDGVDLMQQTIQYGAVGDHNDYQVTFPANLKAHRGGAVILIHGGGWSLGRSSTDASEALMLASAGYVVANVNYSTKPYLQAWPAAADDVFAATDSFRSRADVYGFDLRHVVAAGWSAGGNLAELLGTVGHGLDRVTAVVAWSGIDDLMDLRKTPSTGGCPDVSAGGSPDCKVSKLAAAFTQLVGCDPQTCPDVWVNGSPISHIGPDDARMLFIVGSREYMPNSQSTVLNHELLRQKINHRLVVLDTSLHGGDLRALSVQPLMDWLHQYADTSNDGS